MPKVGKWFFVSVMVLLVIGLLAGSVMASGPVAGAGVALYDQLTGTYFIKDTLDDYPADRDFRYGPRDNDWIPVAGDWNGDGEYGVALYDQTGGIFLVKDDTEPGFADREFRYGPKGNDWIPVAGDWTGDGVYGVALYDQTEGIFLVKDDSTPGFADREFRYGPKGNDWIPVAGDWTGDGVYGVALYDQTKGIFLVKDDSTPGFADREFRYGPKNNDFLPLAGDWTGNGEHGVALYDQTEGQFLVKYDSQPGFADHVFSFGPKGNNWLPVAGIWEMNYINVSNADELYDALLDQCDYDVIRLMADIDEDVNYTVRLACDDLIFDLNGYKLGLDPGYDFQVTADNITITGSEIEIPDGKFDADTGGGITLTIDGVKFVVDGNFDIFADYEGVVSRVDITDSVFNVSGRFYYDIDEDYTEGTLNITRSEFNFGDNFYVDADDDGVKLTVNIIDSKFAAEDVPDWAESFWIDADSTGVIADIIIKNTEFDLGDESLRIETRRAAKASILLENITFTSLGKLIIEGDMELNGATFKEDAGTVVFEWWDTHTLILNGDIVLDHEDNVIELNDDDWYAAQIKGNAVVSGEGKVDIARFSNDDSGIFDIVFETKVEINDAVILSDVTLAETLVNSEFKVYRTVTLTDDMVLGSDVTIFAERAPLPLSEDVKVWGTLVGEGDVKIDGDNGAYFVTFEDKLKVQNVTLADLRFTNVASEAVVVFKDVTIGALGDLAIDSEGTLLFASDIVVTEDLLITFTNAGGLDSVLDGAGFNLLTNDEEVITVENDEADEGTIENLTFVAEVVSSAEGITYEEVMFLEDVEVTENTLMIGGGWVADATITVDDCTITFGKGIDKVYNAGNLVLVNGGDVDFVTDMETDLEFPLP